MGNDILVDPIGWTLSMLLSPVLLFSPSPCLFQFSGILELFERLNRAQRWVIKLSRL